MSQHGADLKLEPHLVAPALHGALAFGRKVSMVEQELIKMQLDIDMS